MKLITPPKAEDLAAVRAWFDALSKHWYPQGVKAGERLAYYAEHFDTVEVDSTYYRLPDEEMVRRWAERTPDGFVMHVKAFGLMTRHPVKVESLPPDLRDEAPTERGRVERLKRLQAEIHEGFKDWVRERRGATLKGDDALLFSGEFWTARRGIEFGLVDSLGELRAVLQARYGEKVRLPVVAARRRLWQRFGFGSSIGGVDSGIGAIGPSLLAALEERAHWQRFGL